MKPVTIEEAALSGIEVTEDALVCLVEEIQEQIDHSKLSPETHLKASIAFAISIHTRQIAKAIYETKEEQGKKFNLENCLMGLLSLSKANGILARKYSAGLLP